jgi:CDP-glycerol glycerophosphotransferase (TagB/SpsB family)
MFINDDRRQRYVDAGLVADNPFAAPLIGYPKVDCLVNGSFHRTEVIRSLGLNPSMPTVLYAPTWSPYSSLNTLGEEVIERLAAEGLQVIVKLHDRSYDKRARGSGSIDWAARLSKYDSHPSVAIANQPDGSAFMVASDAMISDHSSIAFEYTLLDRPLVIIDRPELIERARINPEKVRELRSAALVAQDCGQVVDHILRALHYPGQFAHERALIASKLFYRPGTATDRALAHLYRVLDLPSASPSTELTANRAPVAVG